MKQDRFMIQDYILEGTTILTTWLMAVKYNYNYKNVFSCSEPFP
jgi:hypothetical protein